MAKVCEICDKGVMFGGKRKHQRGSSGGGGVWRFKAQTTRKKWNPNLRKIKVEFANSSVETVKVCMKCYKRIRKEA